MSAAKEVKAQWVPAGTKVMVYAGETMSAPGSSVETPLGVRDFDRYLIPAAEFDRLRKVQEIFAQALVEISTYNGEGRMSAPWQEIVASLGQIARKAIASATALKGKTK
jgi:hypothetical protein